MKPATGVRLQEAEPEGGEAATKKEVDRRDITVPDIHRTGSYKVQVKLHPEVVAEINLEVASF